MTPLEIGSSLHKTKYHPKGIQIHFLKMKNGGWETTFRLGRSIFKEHVFLECNSSLQNHQKGIQVSG